MLLQSETKIEPDLRLQVFSKNLKRQISRSHVTKPWTNIWSSQRGFSTPGSRASRGWLTWTSFILNFCLGHVLIGSLSNENGKKAIGLDMTSKTTTLHVHHSFLYISLPSLHDYDVELPNRPIRLTQCCTQLKSPGDKILCVLHLHYNVAFTFKWYGNSWNKMFYSQRVWIGYNIELAE